MTILGVDYGRRKIGLAVGSGSLSEPLRVLRVSSFAEGVRKVSEVVGEEEVEGVVVGVSEGKMGKEQRRFARELSKLLGIKVKVWDETLTTKDAQRLALEAGVGRARRQCQEDAFAASLMLQCYLESYGTKES